MSEKRVVILDGSGPSDTDVLPILEILCEVLKRDGAKTQVFALRKIRLAHCVGCFQCWIKTPGMCVETDAGRDIARAIVRSDVTVLLTPLTFGGYSPELKKMVDRFVQIATPFFQMDHGEVHHPPRYSHLPRLVMVGVQGSANPAEAHIFKTLAGRNAINFHPPSYAAEVVLSSDDASALRTRFEALLTRQDALPFAEVAASVMPSPVVPSALTNAPHHRRALLIVGSPKTSEPTTSNALGTFLLDRLDKRGWETEVLTLRARLNGPEGARELLSAVERAGLILLVFPLYVDSLPHLLTKALSMIARYRHANGAAPAQRIVAIVNSGFPETYQNAVAIAICKEFAQQANFTWAGGLALGAGGMIGGQSLIGAKPNRRFRDVISALEMTATSLANDLPVPPEAVDKTTRHGFKSAIFSRVYMWMADRSFVKLAAKQGLRKKQLHAQPYAP